MEFFIIDSTANKVITTRHLSHEATLFASLYARAYHVPVTVVRPFDGQVCLVQSDGSITERFSSDYDNSHVNIAKAFPESPYLQVMVEYMYDSGYDSESVKDVLGSMYIKAY